MEPKDKAPIESQSRSSVQLNVRAKSDKAWDYATLHIEDGKKVYICNYCHKVIRGGGINRVKKHLAGQNGEVTPCKKVNADVRFTMLGLLKENEKKAKDKENEVGSSVNISEDDEEEPEARQLQKGKRKATSSSHPFFTKNDSSQPTIKKAMQSKERIHDVDLAIAMWFYDACIPMNACNSPYFQQVVDKITGIGYGYKAPNYHALRINLLEDAKKFVSLLIDSYRSQWIDTGCTIMSDGWTNIRERHLINFLVYCPKGISFIKSVDAADIENNATNLCNLFAEIAEMVGPKNVVQMVTDNAANYKAAGKMLTNRYRHMVWSPCAARCLNLITRQCLNSKEIGSDDDSQ